MMSLQEFEAMLSASARTTIPRIEIGLDKVGHLAESLAAEYPGEYQHGWAPLAESTIDDKTDKGLPVPSPLKREGDMAASYRKELDLPELEMVIGSPELKALWQEMGTSNGGRSIPPRPVCALALEHSLPYAADVFGEIAVSLLMGKA